MKSTAIALLVVLALVCTATAAPELATNVRAMTDILKRTDVEDCAFDLTATVTYVSTNRANENTNIAITDETGASLCRAESRCWLDQTMPVPGARAHLRGYYQKSILRSSAAGFHSVGCGITGNRLSPTADGGRRKGRIYRSPSARKCRRSECRHRHRRMSP